MGCQCHLLPIFVVFASAAAVRSDCCPAAAAAAVAAAAVEGARICCSISRTGADRRSLGEAPRHS